VRLHTLERELAACGFTLHHVRRHRIYRHQTTGRRLIVTAHPGHELSTGNVKAIRRDVQRLRTESEEEGNDAA
jgi:predicted RNA binding protein YcfA (HicA-like mRNA interferase family)